jgi:hypothetical protein
MPKKRVTIPKATEKRAYQQFTSRCGFCMEPEIASLQVHHIDSDPSDNSLENLFLVCGTCHGKITGGVLSETDVNLRKRQIEWMPTMPAAPISTASAPAVSVQNSHVGGDVAQHITKITTSKPPKISHPIGSIGADLRMKGYIDYLLTRYSSHRKADTSFGRRTKFSHAEIHTTIQSEFGSKTFFIPTGHFGDLVRFLQGRIDRTILGKTNLSRGTRNYHSFDEHQP